MTKRELSREAVQSLVIINDMAKEGKNANDSEVQKWLMIHFNQLKQYYNIKE